MNTIATSKEEILQTSRKLIQQQGWSAGQHSFRRGGLRRVGGLHLQLL